MSQILVKASAPSNIALIKYMGKSQASSNLPTNSSLSYTLNYLKTYVEISASASESDEWAPLNGDRILPFEMSEKGRLKYLKHVERVRNRFPCLPSGLKIRSGNDFPSDCGLASSASSFAALTDALCLLAEKSLGEKIPMSVRADLSRQGSGSSCRSFFSPFGLWSGSEVRVLETPFSDLLHAVIVVEAEKKEVSSSEAHERVLTSQLFKGRVERAEQRLRDLLAAMKSSNWKTMYEIVWAEFWDMHALFETSNPHFGYLLPDSLECLRQLDEAWQKNGDGPLVTMDAGPNIHLLYRLDQIAAANQQVLGFSGRFKVYSDPRLSTGKS